MFTKKSEFATPDLDGFYSGPSMAVLESNRQQNCRDFSSEACKKNLEENNAAVRIRHCAARSVIFPRSCGISLFCQVPAVCGCAPKLKSTILSDRRIVFYPETRRRLRLFFSIPTVCIVFSFLFKTLLHLFPQGVKLNSSFFLWASSPSSTGTCP